MSLRYRVQLNLVLSAVNEGLYRERFTLRPGPVDETPYEFEVARLPVLVFLRHDRAADEVTLEILTCPTPLGYVDGPGRCPRTPAYGRAWTTSVLKRRNGAFLDMPGDLYCAHSVIAALGAAEVETEGYFVKPVTAEGRRKYLPPGSRNAFN